MKVIITNDDFGVTYGFTKAIKDSYLKGITTNASIRTNGIYFDLAKKYLENELRGIGVGLHLNLTDGRNRGSFLGYIIKIYSGDKKILRYIEKELEGQYKIKYISMTNEPLVKILLSTNLVKLIMLKFLARINKKIMRKYNLISTDAFY